MHIALAHFFDGLTLYQKVYFVKVALEVRDIDLSIGLSKRSQKITWLA